jgi:hypothetical protein
MTTTFLGDLKITFNLDGEEFDFFLDCDGLVSVCGTVDGFEGTEVVTGEWNGEVLTFDEEVLEPLRLDMELLLQRMEIRPTNSELHF